MKKRTMLVLFAALFILTAALLIGLFLPDSNSEDAGGIALPEQGDEVIDPIPGIAKENSGKVAKITVDKENVQRVIASLSRPEEFGCKTDATYYYDNGSATLESRWWVRPGVCRAMQYDAKGRLRAQVILTENHIYIWGSEGASYYEGSPGDFTADELGRALPMKMFAHFRRGDSRRKIDRSGGRVLCLCPQRDGRQLYGLVYLFG